MKVMKAYDWVWIYLYLAAQLSFASPVDTLLFPQPNATQVPANVRLQIYFNEPVQKGTGNIQIFDATTNTQIFSIPVICACVSITNNKVSIALPSVLSAGQVVYVKIASGVFENNSNEPFDGFYDSTDWRFTIAGGLIRHQNFMPAANSVCVPIAQNTFQVTLSSPAYSNSNGWIKIFEKNTGELHEVIQVSSSQVVANNSYVVSFVISHPLKPATTYFILVEPASFVGSGGFVYEGIYDDSVWAFRTAEKQPEVQHIEICGAGSVLLKANHSDDDVQYRWYQTPMGGEPIKNSSGQVITTDTLRVSVQNTTTFYVSIRKDDCESARSPLQILVKKLPASTLPPQEIKAAKGVKINLEANGGIRYLWQPSLGLSDPTIANPELLVQENITYTVTIENEQGCSTQRQVRVIVDESEKDFFLPTIFSPNNDGIHDFFRIRGKNIAELEWSIYDRHGRLVYRTFQVQEALNTGWDGTFNNTPQPQDTYIWTLKGKFSDGSPLPKAGSVVLIR